MKCLWLFCLVPLFAACQPALPPRPDRVANPPLQFNVPQVAKLTLDNGIRLYLKEDHELPLVEVTVMVGGGSIADPAAQTGLSELFAATLRTGGAGDRTPEEVDALVERLAADFGVSSDTYATTLALSSLSSDLDTVLGLLADTLRRPRFAPQRLALAQQQLQERIRRQNDRPASIASRAMLQALYGDHPLGRTPSEATVAAVGGADLAALHATWFQPGNTWIAVSGDFDRTALLALLAKHLGDWPSRPVPTPPLPPVGAAPRPVLLLAERALPQTVVLLGELGIDKSAPDLQAVRVMNYILGGGGFNSRLMGEIRSDRGLAYSVYSYYQVGRRLPGPFLAQAETKSASTGEVVRLMRAAMERMRSEPVDAEELQLARESLINSFVFAFSDAHEVATQALRLDFYAYPPDYLERYRDQVAAVGADEVLAAARAHLDPARQTLVLVGDAAQFDLAPAQFGLPVERIAP